MRHEVVENREPSGVIWEAVKPLLSLAPSPAFRQGMMGNVARSATEAVTLTDLTTLLIPGLAALGVQAELLPLPEEDTSLVRLLRERLRYGVTLPIFAFAGNEERVSGAEASETETDAESPFEDTERPVMREGLVVAVGNSKILWREGAGPLMGAVASEFRATFTHLLRIQRARSKGSQRANVQAALLRWIAFSDAYLSRLLTADTEDSAQRLLAADFLQEIAGQKRDPVAIRLRRAADRFRAARATADIQAALHTLREAVLLDLRLPAVVQRALLSPPTTPLTDVERRELIYLARAGTRDLKTLAARRLQSERHHADARSTLEQLAYAPDAWVRAAARP